MDCPLLYDRILLKKIEIDIKIEIEASVNFADTLPPPRLRFSLLVGCWQIFAFYFACRYLNSEYPALSSLS